jgi:hypothetical protein
MSNETTTKTDNVLERIVPGVEHYRSIFNANRERADKILAITKKITAIPEEDETLDKYANDLVAKGSKAHKEIEAARKGATKILDEAHAWAMGPEKELLAELERLKKLRNIRANNIETKRKADLARIEAEKEKGIYIGTIKSEIKSKVNLVIAEKIIQTEKSIVEMFNKVQLENFHQLENQLNTTKPQLKRELWETMFTVTFDQNKLSVDEFGKIQDAARGAYTYDYVNNAYIETANKVLAKWREQLPFRKKELEKIASGDQNAVKQAEQRANANNKAVEEESRKRTEKIETEKKEDVAKVSLEAEFKANQDGANLNEQQQENTRTKRIYRLSPETEVDMMKLSTVIGKAIIHMMVQKEFKDGGGIFKLNKDKSIKKDDAGNPVYIDGVQDWLDALASLPYTAEIPGIVITEQKVAVNKVKETATK